jgi:hypothetical protein
MGEAGSRQIGNGSYSERLYERPTDVLKEASLDLAERRAILSAWASDACAVESSPTLRHPAFAKRPVSFDEIMAALAELDRREQPGRSGRILSGRGPLPM